MSSPQVQLYPGFRGFVSGVANSGVRQRAYVEVKREDGTPITSATFEAHGVRVYLEDVFNGRLHWSFGPFNFTAKLFVTISAQGRDGVWRPSKVVGPLSITKQPEPDYPITFHVSTVISEDGTDQSHDDCTVKVLQYRE